MIRAGRNPRVHIAHERSPLPSHVELWGTLDGKREDTFQVPMTEGALYELAEEALRAAGTMRRLREQGRDNVRSEA